MDEHSWISVLRLSDACTSTGQWNELVEEPYDGVVRYQRYYFDLIRLLQPAASTHNMKHQRLLIDRSENASTVSDVTGTQQSHMTQTFRRKYCESAIRERVQIIYSHDT